MVRKITFLILLFIFSGIKVSFCDTTDYYKVFFNDILIKEYSGITTDSLPVILRKDELKKNDIITVKYWDDVPCDNCKFFLIVIDDNKKYVKVVSNVGQGSELSVPISEILDWSVNNVVNTFNIYYYREKPAFPIYLFSVIIQ